MGKQINIRLSSDEKDNMSDDGGLAVQEAKPILKQPSLYQVVMMNDDYTPMEFVVHILQTFFYMDTEKATKIMLAVHTEGKAICGVFPKDIAETKMVQVNECSKENEHPLQCQIQIAD